MYGLDVRMGPRNDNAKYDSCIVSLLSERRRLLASLVYALAISRLARRTYFTANGLHDRPS